MDEAHAGHDRHAGHSVEMFRARFWVCLALTIPTLVSGHMLPSALGWRPPAFPGAALVPPVLGTAVFAYGGWAFLQGAARELRSRLPWAAGYNVFAIPLAAGVLSRWGIVLHPAVGAVLMSASTVIVALNAQLLRRLRP